jgi:hypothetical protein
VIIPLGVVLCCSCVCMAAYTPAAAGAGEMSMAPAPAFVPCGGVAAILRVPLSMAGGVPSTAAGTNGGRAVGVAAD